MGFELHIWGSAFELPSIDPHCLAAILYLRKCLPHTDWVLVPSSDPRVSPLGELPALHDGDLWVAGYFNIVDYLGNISSGGHTLDRDLSTQQLADNAALKAFIVSRGQPLLDLCLYVSSDNYHDCTRPALAKILTWPNSWTIPHRLRDQAKKRSEHLGLNSLDVDTAQEEDEKKERMGLTAQIPKSLRKPTQTVTTLLGKTQQKNRFRLDTVTDDFLNPLSDMLRNKKWLLGDHASSADCLAISYLALMQAPQLKHGWLGQALRTTHSKLNDWARREAAAGFATMADAKSQLPWQAVAPRSAARIFHDVLESSIGAVPVVSTPFANSEITYTTGKGQDRAREKYAQLARVQRHRDLYLEIFTSMVASAGLIAWLMHEGVLRLPRWTRGPPAGKRFGDAGTILGLG